MVFGIVNLGSLFITIYIPLLIGVSWISPNNLIWNKAVLFVGVFLVQLMMDLMNKIKDKCKVKLTEIIYHSFHTASISVLGYSLYTDMLLMETTKEYLLLFGRSKQAKDFVLAAFITAFIAADKIVKTILGYGKCITYA